MGHQLTLADISTHQLLWSPLFAFSQSDFTSSHHIHRWFELISELSPADPPITLSPPIPASVALMSASTANKVTATGAGKQPATSITSSSSNSAVPVPEADEGGTCPPLEGAVEGVVCTRFPPEPSGYLHIGQFHTLIIVMDLNI